MDNKSILTDFAVLDQMLEKLPFQENLTPGRKNEKKNERKDCRGLVKETEESAKRKDKKFDEQTGEMK